MHPLAKVVVILSLCYLAITPASLLANRLEGKPGRPAPRRAAGAQETSVIIVNERALVGPNSAAQLRGGRLFLPITTIAQALGDTLTSDPSTRTVTIRRQNGTIAIFNAQLNEVRENGVVVLTLSGSADL